MATIYIYPKQGDPASVVLKNNPMTLGRLAENDIPLPDPFCSGRHAVIFPGETGGFAIRDNGSKNGTFVNGKKLARPLDLKEGDESLIGGYR